MAQFDDESPIEQSIRKVERAKSLVNRPNRTESIDKLYCGNCQTTIPIAWLEHEIFTKCLCVDGIMYCINCAKLICKGLQKELIGTSKEERLAYYKGIADKIEEHEQLEKFRSKNIVAEIDADDMESARKLFRNRSGSNDNKTVSQMITENAEKAINKSEEKKITIAGSDITKN